MSDLANKLATKPQDAVVKPKDPFAEIIERNMPAIKVALPKHLSPERMARVALTTIRTNPNLQKCNPVSVLASIVQAAQLGLEPGILGHCYIIPYGNEAQFQIGYRGMIDLARRSGNIESIQAHEVYENDLFELEYGLSDHLKHVPWHLLGVTEPGNVRGAYMVAKFKDGGHQIHYMPIKEIEDHRKRSKASKTGPWVSDFVEMCKKTVVRSAWKWLPISIEVMRQVEAKDEAITVDFTSVQDADVIDATPVVEPEPAQLTDGKLI
jgi:recombination protein RecT